MSIIVTSVYKFCDEFAVKLKTLDLWKLESEKKISKLGVNTYQCPVSYLKINFWQ